eukprot:6180748-Pleurochrysis_carterae.AAC.6
MAEELVVLLVRQVGGGGGRRHVGILCRLLGRGERGVESVEVKAEVLGARGRDLRRRRWGTWLLLPREGVVRGVAAPLGLWEPVAGMVLIVVRRGTLGQHGDRAAQHSVRGLGAHRGRGRNRDVGRLTQSMAVELRSSNVALLMDGVMSRMVSWSR